MVKISNLNLEYSKRFSLSVEKLVIEEGKVLTVIGPNGAGKTTLLNVIAMFDRPQSGGVEVFGQDVLNGKNSLSLRRQISFVFSQPYLLNKTVYENVFLPLRLRGVHNGGRAEAMLELFKINHLRDSNAAALSQGEKHRVALARAFVTEPKLLLLDEPFLSLDERYKESLIDELRKIVRSNKITSIFVTQDQAEALSLADSMAVMKDGKILQQGKPQDIFTKPASREVADFVGVETIIEGIIARKEDNLCFIKVADKVLEAVSAYNAGDSVFICIRPEDVVLSRYLETTSARNNFKAKIINIDPWGLEYKLNLDCGFDLAASVTKQSLENLDLKIGEEIFVSFKATAIHVIRREAV
jgi:tungstate transport system ATP-binding protein